MTTAPAARLTSVDALRGFDMCWILGLSGIVTKLAGPGWLADQMEHVDWAGFRFMDLIFPLFLFISGVSMSIALPRRIERAGTGAAVQHLVWRAVIIFALGVLYSGGLQDGWEKIRWLGVLQRIGLASAGAGLLSIYFGTRGLIVWLAALLVGYFCLLAFIPVPGHGIGNFAEGQNLTNWLDKMYLPGRKYDGDHDPEGLLSTFPAIATAILGLLAGRWLQGTVSPMRKVGGLLVAGAVLLALGWAWHPYFPVVKKLWTSSFVLVAGGLSAMALGGFYWVIDVQRWQPWAVPFVWVGANPITLYLLDELGVFRAITERLIGEPHGQWSLLTPAVAFLLMLGFARWMHRRGIFLKV